MGLDNSAIGKALADLFPPNKKTAPKAGEVDEQGCPGAPEDTEQEGDK